MEEQICPHCGKKLTRLSSSIPPEADYAQELRRKLIFPEKLEALRKILGRIRTGWGSGFSPGVLHEFTERPDLVDTWLEQSASFWTQTAKFLAASTEARGYTVPSRGTFLANPQDYIARVLEFSPLGQKERVLSMAKPDLPEFDADEHEKVQAAMGNLRALKRSLALRPPLE